MSNDRQLNYVNNLQNRDQNLYYVDDVSELNSINLEENDKIYAINDNKLFQMEIVDQEEELSGSIVSFNGRNNTKIKSLVANIRPRQDLHGYDNPWPGGGGKNILQMIAPSAARGISFSLNDDGSLHVSGTATANATFYINGSTYASNNTAVIPAGTYTAFCQTFMMNGNENTRVTFNGKKEDGTNPSSSTLLARADGTRNTLTFTTAESFKAALYLFINSGEVCNFDIKVQLEAGSIATAYTPYSNICPISGWTGLSGKRTGKNLLLLKNLNETISRVTLVTDPITGVVTFNGTRSGNGIRNVSDTITLPAGIYKLACEGYDENIYPRVGLASDGLRIAWLPESPTFTLTESTDVLYQFFIRSNIEYTNFISKPMLLMQAETDDTFEPYSGQFISVTFPIEAGTVYGGTLTINPDRTGQLVVDRKLVDVANTNWTYNASFGGFNVLYANFSDMVFGVDQVVAICSKYKTVGRQLADKLCLVNSSCISSSTPTIGIIDTTYASKTEFVAGIADVQIVYELATPTTYQLTESEISGILTTIYGTNNIWADTGDITVKIVEKGKTAFELEPYI